MNQLERPRDEEDQEDADCHHDNSDGTNNNNNNNRRKTVCPAAGEHPLQYNYTFWYSRRTPTRPASSLSYEQNIRQIGTVASVTTHSSNTNTHILIHTNTNVKY
ncbi:eukaryotic translation initiation factor 4E type 2-like [Acanthochromis polyacanthus]|uniref:eukaryotic translation initiation factor 4E type 2-like n=1 Tax=Acanthochromis polyacanthus TaxID=80966 RepID=UPI0022340BBF|nr:eukaryotic translation initiation factor 4E type 2-like [Acanthochromis polyacanthus]